MSSTAIAALVAGGGGAVLTGVLGLLLYFAERGRGNARVAVVQAQRDLDRAAATTTKLEESLATMTTIRDDERERSNVLKADVAKLKGILHEAGVRDPRVTLDRLRAILPDTEAPDRGDEDGGPVPQ